MIVGPNGQPVQKPWEEMSADEKLLVVREGIGFLMRQNQELIKIVTSVSNSVEAIVEAIEEGTGKPAEETVKEAANGVE